MKKKHYHIMHTCLYGAGALFFLSLPLWLKADDDGFGIPFGFFMAAVFAYLSYRNFKQIKESREEDQVYRPNTDDTVDQQIAFYKTYTYISAIGFPILSIIVFIDLNDLISGSVQRVSLLQPAAFVYEQFGYWPAVLTFPIAGVFVTLLGIRKMYILKSARNNSIR